MDPLGKFINVVEIYGQVYGQGWDSANVRVSVWIRVAWHDRVPVMEVPRVAAGGHILAAVLDQVLVRALNLDEGPGVAPVVVRVDCETQTRVAWISDAIQRQLLRLSRVRRRNAIQSQRLVCRNVDQEGFSHGAGHSDKDMPKGRNLVTSKPEQDRDCQEPIAV